MFSQNFNTIMLSLELEAKIPQNRPNLRVFDIFGQNLGRKTPPPYFGDVEIKKEVISREEPLFVDFLNFGKEQLLKS